MGEFGEISWEWELERISNPSPAHHFFDPDRSFLDYLDFLVFNLDPDSFREEAILFEKSKSQFQKEYEKFTETIGKIPFFAAVSVWVKEYQGHYPECNEIAKDLFSHNLLGPYKNGQKKAWALAHASIFDHRKVLNAIRCKNDCIFQKKEKLVRGYVAIINWLSSQTNGYIKPLSDPDLLRSARRALIHPLFINFLEVLKDKERLVAKLLYFGGSRTLEGVLQLELENVLFTRRCIQYGSHVVDYPEHVFNDIKLLTSSRTSGRVFLGRKDAPLNPATIFRNFKEAAQKIGLDQNFSPKSLTTDG
ncbi:MAG: hypothetical protein WB791_06170 [Waddliaceae bacterium]